MIRGRRQLLETMQRDDRVVRFAEHALHARERLDGFGACAPRRQRRKEFQRVAQPLRFDPHAVACGRIERRERRRCIQMTEQTPHALGRMTPQRRRVGVVRVRQCKHAQPFEPAERQPRIARRMQHLAQFDARGHRLRARRVERAVPVGTAAIGRDQAGQALGREHVPVAHRAEQRREPAQIGAERVLPSIVREARKETHQRAQPAQRDAHLVHEFGIVALEHPCFIAEPLRGDIGGQREQRGPLRADASQIDELRLHGPGHRRVARARAVDHAGQLHERGPCAAQFARGGEQRAQRGRARGDGVPVGRRKPQFDMSARRVGSAVQRDVVERHLDHHAAIVRPSPAPPLADEPQRRRHSRRGNRGFIAAFSAAAGRLVLLRFGGCAARRRGHDDARMFGVEPFARHDAGRERLRARRDHPPPVRIGLDPRPPAFAGAPLGFLDLARLDRYALVAAPHPHLRTDPPRADKLGAEVALVAAGPAPRLHRPTFERQAQHDFQHTRHGGSRT
ncbi:hypothetical protein BLAT2472_40314 [Burkholderia latens]